MSYLLIALLGEIGNNSFDHNPGNWLDRPGVYFKIDYEMKMMALADRGQGVFRTIKKVRPKILLGASFLLYYIRGNGN